MEYFGVVVVGGGPAGLAAACAASANGAGSVALIERNEELGGILNQCIHTGFGLQRFKEELSGPEYAHRCITLFNQSGAKAFLSATVVSIDKNRVEVVSPEGFFELEAGAIVLAMGCRERPRGAISIPGDRPAGIFTAGAAQRYVNIDGCKIGNSAVILGSGDIGLIMARRLTLEGMEVKAVVEIMPYPGGLTRNIVQCLNDFSIPLMLSHAVIQIHGEGRLDKVTIAEVDENRNIIAGTEFDIECDTLLLSVGLIPENEIAEQVGALICPHTGGAVVYENMETTIPGIFACGNVAHIHDLADMVSAESERAGEAAAKYALGLGNNNDEYIEFKPEGNIRYVLPQRIRRSAARVEVSFRVKEPCNDISIVLRDDTKELQTFFREQLLPSEMHRISVSGNSIRLTNGNLYLGIIL